MKLNSYDRYLIDEVLPDMAKALKKEDALFGKKFRDSVHKKFYRDDVKGVSSYVLTERTIQYIFFRELCVRHKIIPEENSYSKSQERLDLVIYKNIEDYDNHHGEIGIELKQVNFKTDSTLYSKSLDKVVDDFDKIKRAENKNKYLLLAGISKFSLEVDELNKSFLSKIDNRMFRKYLLKVIAIQSFKTESGYEENKMNLLVVKLVEKKN